MLAAARASFKGESRFAALTAAGALTGVDEDTTTSCTATSPGLTAAGAEAGAAGAGDGGVTLPSLSMEGSLEPGAPGAQWPSSSGKT
jgi:hypothetical protein